MTFSRTFASTASSLGASSTSQIQLAKATRTLHDHHFVHNDLKWRNLLVDEQRRLFLIDCPAGTFWWGPFLRYRIVKDVPELRAVLHLPPRPLQNPPMPPVSAP